MCLLFICFIRTHILFWMQRKKNTLKSEQIKILRRTYKRENILLFYLFNIAITTTAAITSNYFFIFILANEGYLNIIMQQAFEQSMNVSILL